MRRSVDQIFHGVPRQEALLLDRRVGFVRGAIEFGRGCDDSVPVLVVVLPLCDHFRAHILQRAGAARGARASGRRSVGMADLPWPLPVDVEVGVVAGSGRARRPVARRQEVVVPRLVAVRTHCREIRVRRALRGGSLEVPRIHGIGRSKVKVGLRLARKRRPRPERRVDVVCRFGLHPSGSVRMSARVPRYWSRGWRRSCAYHHQRLAQRAARDRDRDIEKGTCAGVLLDPLRIQVKGVVRAVITLAARRRGRKPARFNISC